jgi:hypothetical protein
MEKANVLLAQAQNYHRLGLAVLPFVIGVDGKKKPAVDSWKQWQYRAQTKEEFDALHIENYKLFGVLCGSKIKINCEELFFRR